jgi:hypothetical protein
MRRRGSEVRVCEPQKVQGCKKIEPAAFQVNSYKVGDMRRGLQFRKKDRGIALKRAVWTGEMTEK